MIVARARAVVAVVAVLAASACDSSTPPEPIVKAAPPTLDAVAGNGQTGLVGTTLPIPLRVVATTSTGDPMVNATVNFVVTSGDATVSPPSAPTDADGIAETDVTLGQTPGPITITASVQGTELTTTFVLASGTGSITGACSAGSAQTPAAGAVIPSVSGTGICLGGGSSGADYALIAFNSNPDSNLVSASFGVKGSNITTILADRMPVMDARMAGVSPLRAKLVPPSRDRQVQFDRRLREMAIRRLTSRMPGAQRAMSARSAARFDVIPRSVQIGQVLRLNANGNEVCENPINIGAKVVAISNSAIILADTANPTTDAFTTSDYTSFGTTFDDMVNPLDVDNFGQPTDIDKNGKVVILFTKEVNRLTSSNPDGSFVGGFFFERDLFPTTDNPALGLEGCAASNFGEIFYVLVPDPNGTQGPGGGPGVKHTKADVLNNTTGTLAHEYQHLINAGRRLYINKAVSFEAVWLNEGLSHIAEELLFYRASGLAPRQNLGFTEVGQHAALFNRYQADNVGRFEIFLGKPALTDPYGDNDELETRGATWSMLRYLADHRGTSDADVWKSLVNTTSSGQHNLAQVFGDDYMTLIRNWSTSTFTDDFAGVSDTRFLAPSWNMRSIMPHLCVDNNDPCNTLDRYPLATTSLTNNTSSTQVIVPGGTSYMRFSVPANAEASIDWSLGNLPVTPFVQFTVVRTR
jgi:hypothetical protein